MKCVMLYSTITDTKEIVGRSTSSSSTNTNQQTASIIVVTAAMTSTSMTPSSMSIAGATRSTGNLIHLAEID